MACPSATLPRVGENTTRALQYVAMTHGRESNTAYLYERRAGAVALLGPPLANPSLCCNPVIPRHEGATRMTVFVSYSGRGRNAVKSPVLTGVLAAIGAVVLVLFLSGCQGPSGGQASTASSSSAAPSSGQQGPTEQGPYRVTATVPAGKGSSGVAVDPSTHTVYVTDRDDGTVSVIDGATRTVTATVPVGKDPIDLAVDPSTHTVYIAHIFDNTVSVIDGATRTVTATVPVGNLPVDLAVNASTHTVYVANGNDNTVSVIDGATRTVTATVPVGKSLVDLAVDPSTHTVYIANGNENTVSVIDGATRTVTATVPVGKGPG